MTTEAGKRLLERYPDWYGLAAIVSNIEDEAREDYAPAALSPEWSRDIDMVNAATEAVVAAERARIAAAVREFHDGICACPGDGSDPDCNADWGYVEVLAMIEGTPE